MSFIMSMIPLVGSALVLALATLSFFEVKFVQLSYEYAPCKTTQTATHAQSRQGGRGHRPAQRPRAQKKEKRRPKGKKRGRKGLESAVHLEARKPLVAEFANSHTPKLTG
jgi:hypothetical protein